MAMPMPTTMLVVRGSPNINVPTRMAVIGSKTPSTEAFVAPILRVAMARVAVETIVGSRAKPTKLSQSPPVVMLALKMLLSAQVNSAFSGFAGLKLPLFIHSPKVEVATIME